MKSGFPARGAVLNTSTLKRLDGRLAANNIPFRGPGRRLATKKVPFGGQAGGRGKDEHHPVPRQKAAGETP